MRAPNDGRGDDRWPQESGSSSADHETTQAFTRREPAPAPGEQDGPGPGEQARSGPEEPTQDFTRGPSAPSGPDDLTTQAFTRDAVPGAAPASRPGTPHAPEPEAGSPIAASEPDEDGADGEERRGFTRRFVRNRVVGRGQSPSGGPGPDDTPADHRRPDPYGPPPGPEHPEPRVSEPTSPRGRDRRDPPPPSPRRRRRRRFRLRWILTMIVVIALAIPPGTWGWVWYTARQDDRDPSDAIIVLGASQYNGVPSPVFEARLSHAQNLYQQGVAPMIITVGGKQPDDTYTEAAAGRDWLVEVGIPSDQVVAVEEGADTLQSIVAVAEVYDQQAWETGIIVSDPWHSLRAQRMAAGHGIDAGTSPARSGPAVIERSTQLWYITRETASLWYYWIFNDSSDIRVNAA